LCKKNKGAGGLLAHVEKLEHPKTKKKLKFYYLTVFLVFTLTKVVSYNSFVSPANGNELIAFIFLL